MPKKLLDNLLPGSFITTICNQLFADGVLFYLFPKGLKGKFLHLNAPSLVSVFPTTYNSLNCGFSSIKKFILKKFDRNLVNWSKRHSHVGDIFRLRNLIYHKQLGEKWWNLIRPYVWPTSEWQPSSILSYITPGCLSFCHWATKIQGKLKDDIIKVSQARLQNRTV